MTRCPLVRYRHEQYPPYARWELPHRLALLCNAQPCCTSTSSPPSPNSPHRYPTLFVRAAGYLPRLSNRELQELCTLHTTLPSSSGMPKQEGSPRDSVSVAPSKRMSERRGEGCWGKQSYTLGKGRVGREARVHLALYLGIKVAQLQGLVPLVRSHQLGESDMGKYLLFHP